MQAQVDDLHGGGDACRGRAAPEASRERHVGARQAAAARRVDALLDPGFAVSRGRAVRRPRVYDDDIPSAGVIAGIGRVEGRECMICATTRR
jgi:3-methylcrotonyl-CoA carboxylase beta subunit